MREAAVGGGDDGGGEGASGSAEVQAKASRQPSPRAAAHRSPIEVHQRSSAIGDESKTST